MKNATQPQPQPHKYVVFESNTSIVARIEAGEDDIYDKNWVRRSFCEYMRRIWPKQNEVWKRLCAKYYTQQERKTNPFIELTIALCKSAASFVTSGSSTGKGQD